MPGTKRPIHQYPEDALVQALQAIRENKMPVREASRRFGVPRGTLQDRLHNRVAEGPRKMGPSTILTEAEELKIVQWLITLAKCGFARKKDDLLNTVKDIVTADGRNTPFKDNRPGNKWYSSFLRRHPVLTTRTAEGISKGRAVVSEECIRKWFRNLYDYLEEIGAKDILEDPRRILNGDETSFSMCPKTGKVIAPKGWKNVYDIQRGNEKETITVLLVFTASGETLTPMVVFPYIRPPKEVVSSMPEGWFLGRSDSGWMKSDVFFEYIINGVDKWLVDNLIPKPILLLVDGHRTHLTMELSRECSERNIILYCLPPNTTHIMQPADVSVFKPLKSEWKKTVRDWQNDAKNVNSILTKSNFCPLLAKILGHKNLPTSIQNGFRKCGLYPFNPSAVDYSKCIQNQLESLNVTNTAPQNELKYEDFNTTKEVILELRNELTLRGQDVDVILETVNTAMEKFTPERPATLFESQIEIDAELLDFDIEPGLYEVQDTSLVSPCPVSALSMLTPGPSSNSLTLSDDNLAITPQKSDTSRPTTSEKVSDLSTTITAENSDCRTPDSSPSVQLSSLSSSGITPTPLTTKKSLLFDSHLYFPSPIPMSAKRKKALECRENIPKTPPKAISSTAWREWYCSKEQQKKQREETLVKKREEKKKVTEERRLSETKSKKNTVRRRKLPETHSRISSETGAIKCTECQEELVSDIEDDDLKNVGCDNCPKWFHLKCTKLKGLSFDFVSESPFQCKYC